MSQIVIQPETSGLNRISAAWRLFLAALRPGRLVEASVMTEADEDVADVAAFDRAMAENGNAPARPFEDVWQEIQTSHKATG